MFIQDLIEDNLESSSSEDGDFEPQTQSSTIFKYFKSLLAVLILWRFSYKVSNAAFNALLLIIKQFFIYTGHSLGLTFIQEIGESIPLTLAAVYCLTLLLYIKLKYISVSIFCAITT